MELVAPAMKARIVTFRQARNGGATVLLTEALCATLRGLLRATGPEARVSPPLGTAKALTVAFGRVEADPLADAGFAVARASHGLSAEAPNRRIGASR